MPLYLTPEIVAELLTQEMTKNPEGFKTENYQTSDDIIVLSR